MTVALSTIVATERREQDRRLRETFVKRDRRAADRRTFEAFATIEALSPVTPVIHAYCPHCGGPL